MKGKRKNCGYNLKNWSLCIFSHAQGGRWRQLVITCLVSLAVPSHVAICPLIQVQRISNPDQSYGAWSTLHVGLPQLGVCQSMPKGFIFHLLFIYNFLLILFEWIFIGKNNHTFWGSFKMTLSCYKVFKLLEEESFQSFKNLM